MKKTTSLPELLEHLADDGGFHLALLEEGLIHRVALRVLELRRALRLSQADVARRLGTKQPSVARIEAGDANLTLRTLAQLSVALECSPEDFVADRPVYTGGLWEQPKLTVIRGGLAHGAAAARSWQSFTVDRLERKVAAV